MTRKYLFDTFENNCHSNDNNLVTNLLNCEFSDNFVNEVECKLEIFVITKFVLCIGWGQSVYISSGPLGPIRLNYHLQFIWLYCYRFFVFVQFQLWMIPSLLLTFALMIAMTRPRGVFSRYYRKTHPVISLLYNEMWRITEISPRGQTTFVGPKVRKILEELYPKWYGMVWSNNRFPKRRNRFIFHKFGSSRGETQIYSDLSD